MKRGDFIPLAGGNNYSKITGAKGKERKKMPYFASDRWVGFDLRPVTKPK